MSGFTREEYVRLANALRVGVTDSARPEVVLPVYYIPGILAALDIAAADPAPRTAEPEADGDRTVHPATDGWRATDLLRRVTELEKLANATALCVVRTAPADWRRKDLDEYRNAWLKTRGEWVS